MTLTLSAPTTNPDITEVVNELLHIGNTWAGPLPADLSDTSIRRRIEGAWFSVLVTIDGDGGPGPLQLSPKEHPDIDLGGLALHEVNNPTFLDSPDQRRLLMRLERVTAAHATRSLPLDQLMGRYLTAVCCVLATHYQLRLIDFDEDTGEVVRIREDIAQHLPAAFAAAWAGQTAPAGAGFPDRWPPKAGEVWAIPASTTNPRRQTAMWLAFREEVPALDHLGSRITHEIMMVNGFGDVLVPDDLLAQCQRLDTLPILVGDPRTPATPAGGRTWTHPDVLTIGVRDGWADPETDPTNIDWATRQAHAAIPFQVVDGHPVNPCERTPIRWGRNALGHWGELLAADALVTAADPDGHRWIVMVERTDGHGWALPGGAVDPNEDPADAAARELAEETGLYLPGAGWHVHTPRYVPDPRASDEAWMVTVLATTDLGTLTERPTVVGADDARRAAWVQADSYDALVAELTACYGGAVFAAHRAMLAETLS